VARQNLHTVVEMLSSPTACTPKQDQEEPQDLQTIRELVIALKRKANQHCTRANPEYETPECKVVSWKEEPKRQPQPSQYVLYRLNEEIKKLRGCLTLLSREFQLQTSELSK